MGAWIPIFTKELLSLEIFRSTKYSMSIYAYLLILKGNHFTMTKPFISEPLVLGMQIFLHFYFLERQRSWHAMIKTDWSVQTNPGPIFLKIACTITGISHRIWRRADNHMRLGSYGSHQYEAPQKFSLARSEGAETRYLGTERGQSLIPSIIQWSASHKEEFKENLQRRLQRLLPGTKMEHKYESLGSNMKLRGGHF